MRARPKDHVWWRGTPLVAFLMILSTAPLWFPQVLPLGDLPGHMGQYAVELADPSSPIRRYYSFHWALIPNIGVDLLMLPIGQLLGIEPAAKLITLSIPPLTIFGFSLTARAFHGEQPATLPLAAALAYNQFFLLGFVNYTLSCALAFLALPLWVALSRAGRLRTRSVVFLLIAPLVWLCQAFGWAILVVLVLSAEWSIRAVEEQGSGRRAFASALACWPLGLPLVPTLVWQTGTPANAGEGVDLGQMLVWKLLGIARVLDDRWIALDLASVLVLLLFIGIALRNNRAALSPGLATAAALLVALFLVLPKQMMGANHVDDRLLPYGLALALLAIGRNPAAFLPRQSATAAFGLAFFTIRMGATAVGLWLSSSLYSQLLPALDHVPRGASLASFVEEPCTLAWAPNPLEHLASLALVRREAYANDQWAIAGGQLSSPRPPWSRYSDPSQIVVSSPCWSLEGTATLDDTIRRLPNNMFGYLWLIDVNARPSLLGPSWVQIWRSGGSVLYAHRATPGEALPP